MTLLYSKYIHTVRVQFSMIVTKYLIFGFIIQDQSGLEFAISRFFSKAGIPGIFSQNFSLKIVPKTLIHREMQ